MLVQFTHPDKNMKILINPHEIVAAEPFILKGKVPTYTAELLARAEAIEASGSDEVISAADVEAGTLELRDHFEFCGTDLLLRSGQTVRVKEKAGIIIKRLANAGVEFA